MMWFIEFNIVFAIVVLLFKWLLFYNGNIKWNRWILIALPILFLFSSLIKPYVYTSEEVAFIVLPTVEITQSSSSTNTFNWLYIIYLTGLIVSFFLILFSVFSILKKRKQSELIRKENNVSIYRGDFDGTFFNTIFFSEKKYSNSEKDLVLLHEKAHAKSLHSADRIFSRIVQSFLWFNPAVYLWQKMIAENHEFLADKAVLKHSNYEDYTLFLLEQKMNHKNIKPFRLTSNMSNLKSRVMKMNQKVNRVKYAYLIIPAFAVTMFSFAYSPEKATKSTSEKSIIQKDPIEDPDVYPKFKGGSEAMANFFSNNLVYPESAKEDNIQGKVFLSILIENDGSIKNVEVLRGINDDFDNEAIRVAKKMPNWEPGEKNGKTVPVKVVLPINFQTNEK